MDPHSWYPRQMEAFTNPARKPRTMTAPTARIVAPGDRVPEQVVPSALLDKATAIEQSAQGDER